MSGRDIGSTTSLQVVPQGGEAIPREFHRKILKKIAQLTKVIHLLNTKNDEHEAFVQKLRSLHEAEVVRVLTDGASRLRKCQEELGREKEGRETRVEEVRGALREVEKERDKLVETQVSYRKEVDERLGILKAEHIQQVKKLAGELQRLKGEQSKQIREVSELRNGFSRKAEEQVKTLTSKHQRQLDEIAEKEKTDRQKLEKQLDSLKAQQQRELERLRQQHKLKLDGERERLLGAQGEIISVEKGKRQDMEHTLRKEFTEREEGLKQQVSTLSNELRVTKDRLALAEQRVREMELHYQEDKEGSSSLKEKLEAALGESEDLRRVTGSLETELEIAREQYRQQSGEMQGLSASLARLEAVRVAHQGKIGELQSQLSGMQEKLGWLEREREAMLSSQSTASQKQTERIKALEKELERVGREKRELRAQYAREIEAAHSQLGDREAELVTKHARTLHDQRDLHQNALQEARQEQENALDDLRHQLEAAARQEIQGIIGKQASEIAILQDSIASKTSELKSTQEELERVRLAMSEREKGLGSATGQVERLTVELGRVREEMKQGETASVETRKENTLLKSSLESLRSEQVQSLQEHREEVQRAKASLTQQLEQKWMQRIKQECASLRLELSQRHSEDSRSALHELASLKDSAMREARGQWEKERDALNKKVEDLDRQLQALLVSASASVEEARSTAGEAMSSLRQQLEKERSGYAMAEKEMKQAHQVQLQSQQQNHDVDKKHLIEKLLSQHRSELRSMQQSHQLAVVALREQWEKERKEGLEGAAERHSQELGTLHAQLVSQQEGELARLRELHGAEIQARQRELQEVLSQRQREESNYESILSSLRGEVVTRDSELSQLRDRVNTLTVAVSGLRKELQVKGQEVIAVRRETNSIMRMREQQLSSAHQAEVESLGSQHRHQTQLLLSDFNRAKEMLNTRIAELERRLSDSEHRYRNRHSKPEDIQAIKELKLIVLEQERRMKELVAEKRIYQLELMNREKNYNKLFSSNPHVGVMDPLQFKKKRVSENSSAPRHASAPSLVASSFDLSQQPVLVSLEAKPRKLPELESVHNPSEARHRKLVVLQDSPLTQQKFSKSRTVNSHNTPLHPTPPSVSPPKQTMVVQ